MDQPAAQHDQAEQQPESLGPLHVAICAATYRRPDGLRRLLLGLFELKFAGQSPQITIIIADNDPDGSAAELVRTLSQSAPWTIHYVHETQPGTPFARNAALDAVPDHIDFVCFIDDDEAPLPDWLDRLSAAQQLYDADVVTGPVLAEYETGVPMWVQRGGFFQRPRYETGTERPFAFTNNVLMRANLVRDEGRRFDTQFLKGVGEDQAFFQQIAHDGGRIVWADDAIVREWIPAGRARAGWLIRRMFHIGRSMTLTIVRLESGASVRFLQLAKGFVWIAIATVTLPCGLFARRWAVRSLRWAAYGTGLIRGLF